MTIQNETESTNVEDSNRWKERFGGTDEGAIAFINYMTQRFIRVRGQTIDTEHPDKQLASDKYIRTLVEESEYWADRATITDVVKEILAKSKVADDFTYIPLADELIEQGGQNMFNRYRSPCTEECEPTCNEKILWNNYWVHLLPNEAERLCVQQWVAHLAFKPNVRSGVAVLLHGVSNGTGKGTLGEVLTALVGNSNTEKPTNPNEILTGRFNGALDGKVLFIVDELYAGGSFKTANGVKSKITEPTLSIEKKGQEPRTIKNYCNFLATSNHLTPIWLDQKDRRWEVYNVEYAEGKEAAHKEAVKSFREWFEEDKAHATKVVRRLLQQVDLSNYKPECEGSMMTDAKQRLIKNSVSSVEEDFTVFWNEQEFDKTLVVNATDAFKDFEQNVKGGQRADILTNLGCRKFISGSSIKIKGTQSRSWWITPAGLNAGIQPYMNGGEVGDILEQKLASVTNVYYDPTTDKVEVTKRCSGF